MEKLKIHRYALNDNWSWRGDGKYSEESFNTDCHFPGTCFFDYSYFFTS